MTVNTGKVTGRHTLRFASIDDAIAEAQRVATNPCRLLGNWSVGQNLDHLARTLRVSFDGPYIMAPWFARTFIAPFMKKTFVEKAMPSGFLFTKQMEAFRPDDKATAAVAIEKFCKQFSRLKLETPTAPHPFFGMLTRDEWVGVQLRHCEMHLSFLAPEGA